MLYKGNYKMTSDFGKRTLDNGDTRYHNGIDFVGLESKYITATTDGTVMSSTIITNKGNPTWEWGNYVKVVDDKGYSHFYCHLSQRFVKAGQKIKKGDGIGIEGQTGYSFGSHCHYEVRNPKGVSIDPKNYIAGLYPIVEEMTVNKAKEKLKSVVGLEDSTVIYLADNYIYGDSLMLKLGKAIRHSPKDGDLKPEGAKIIVKDSAGLEDGTVNYISECYRYGKDLIVKLAKCMI